MTRVKVNACSSIPFGAAWDYLPERLDGDFFSSDIVVFGGTALVPQNP